MSHFHVDAKGNIVGPSGLTFLAEDQYPPGVVKMDITLLDRLFELGMAEQRIQSGTSDQVSRKMQSRIEAAKADLADDLGIDPDMIR